LLTAPLALFFFAEGEKIKSGDVDVSAPNFAEGKNPHDTPKLINLFNSSTFFAAGKKTVPANHGNGFH